MALSSGEGSFFLLCLWFPSWMQREVLLLGCCVLATDKYCLGCVWSVCCCGSPRAEGRSTRHVLLCCRPLQNNSMFWRDYILTSLWGRNQSSTALILTVTASTCIICTVYYYSCRKVISTQINPLVQAPELEHCCLIPKAWLCCIENIAASHIYLWSLDE